MSYIVVYDLPSENLSYLSAEEKRIVRNVRVRSIQLLHKLGIQCTESVILVSPTMVDKVDSTIDKVMDMYRSLDFLTYLPIIRKLSLTQDQFETFRDLADRRILEVIDSTIERISNLLDEIDNIVDQNILNRIRYNLNRTKSNIIQLREFAKQLDISRDRDFDLLISIIDKAIEKTRGDQYG